MSTLKTLLKQATRDEPLFLTAPHAQWLEMPESEQVYSERAIAHVVSAMRGRYKRERSGRFSPSALGLCMRRGLFGYAGAPQQGENPDILDLMGLGNWGHWRWQAEGLSSGWLSKAEVWSVDREYPVGGTLDGLNSDDSIFELKTTRSQLFTKIVDREGEPKYDHLLQVHAYMRMTRRNKASLVYEDRDSGQFHEFRVVRDPDISRAVRELFEELTQFVRDDALPPMLDECEMRRGLVYGRCPYRTFCPTATRVTL